jgi:glutathione synthase/RimK-type ligase-like ATP-grasp enzyme
LAERARRGAPKGEAMILILTDATDTHADHLEQKLQRRGATFRRFDPGQFPSKAEISVKYSSTGKTESQLSAGDEQIDLESIKSVWFRRPSPSIAHEEITDDVAREYIAEESKTFMHDAWNAMECFWLPAPPPVIRKAEFKASQLRLAGSLGFELPPTLFTNNPDAFLDFYREHNGNIVSKIPSSSLYRFIGTRFNRYTQVVSKRDIAHARGIQLCPMIFQAYVPKRVELRITVVGRDVFAAEIHSQHSNHTRHDWRRYDRYQTPYFQHELPRALQSRCIELVERLGLCYGAIDMVLTPDGRYVFLEINPNGQYLWIEEMTGLPISDSICDLLISGARPYEPALQTSPRRIGVGA